MIYNYSKTEMGSVIASAQVLDKKLSEYYQEKMPEVTEMLR
jgi:hypothetical protein